MRITREHINSILFGVAVGDALGVPVEFTSREYLKKNPISEMQGYGTYDQPKGTWSDDSTMTFCLAETLLDDEFELQKLANRFINWVDWGYWTPHGELFDIGNTTHSAIERLRTIDKPELAGGSDETENGNGSLMRILPLVLETSQNHYVESWDLISNVSSLTHRHIRSIISCYYYLLFARKLMQGQSKESAYQQTNTLVKLVLKEKSIDERETVHFQRILNGEIPSLISKDIRGSGYVVDSLESSLWCLLNSNSYKDAVLKAIHLGEDTDTTAAITGGIAALSYGFESIPKEWINELVKKHDIIDLSTRLSDKYTMKIKLSDVPEIGDISGANKFVHQFSGYRITFAETSKAARETKKRIELGEIENLSVDDLAESLFFHFRAIRHGGGNANGSLVSKHIELIRNKLQSS